MLFSITIELSKECQKIPRIDQKYIFILIVANFTK